jgi:Coenzyme PQQ synthesis protein D (PqqD)
MAKIGITESTIIQRRSDILTSDLDGEKVMMSIEKGEYYGLGKTGTFIWDHIIEAISINDLVTMITDKYSIKQKECLEDIIPFIADLIEKELIIAT